MDFQEQFHFLTSKLGLNVAVFGKDHRKCHRGPRARTIFFIVKRSDGDRLHYRDTLPDEDRNRIKNWIRCGDPTGLTAEWKEVHATPDKKWKAYLAGERQEIDCSGVVDEMFVDDNGEKYTYYFSGSKWIKITHPEDRIKLASPGDQIKTASPKDQIRTSMAKNFRPNSKEQEVYNIIFEDTGETPPGAVVISHLAKDLDDLTAMTVIKELDRGNKLRLKAYIANLDPAPWRAIYGRSALDSLELPHVPMGVGTKGSIKNYGVYPGEFDSPLMPDVKTFKPNKDNFFESGFELLDRVFKQAIKDGQKLILILLSSLQDIAEYTKAHPETFRKAVRRPRSKVRKLQRISPIISRLRPYILAGQQPVPSLFQASFKPLSVCLKPPTRA